MRFPCGSTSSGLNKSTFVPSGIDGEGVLLRVSHSCCLLINTDCIALICSNSTSTTETLLWRSVGNPLNLLQTHSRRYGGDCTFYVLFPINISFKESIVDFFFFKSHFKCETLLSRKWSLPWRLLTIKVNSDSPQF